VVSNGGERDPTKGAKTIETSFAPAEVTVRRVDDETVVCEKQRNCTLPIDVNYRAESVGFEPLLISGDDLYDRRFMGKWRLVMKPVEPKPTKKRRRRGRKP
jgi:hypothetical protein